MRNDATIRMYYEKVLKAQEQMEEALLKAREQLKTMERQEAVIYGQAKALEQLLDYDNVPPIVDLPNAGSDIAKRHAHRLDGPQGLSEEETVAERKDVYIGEAMNNAREIDAINKESSREDAEDHSEASGSGRGVSQAG
jgi:hypothetical protein